MLHVGMNVEDKAGLFAEVARVLRPGGVFGIYDIMREGEGALAYPVPWAATEETSFLVDAATYRRLLDAAGFEAIRHRSRRDFALDFFRRLRARAATPPAGGDIVMGEGAAEKRRNIVATVERGLSAPVEIVARRR
jgi:SAM-dependent methyltransferase